MTNPNKDVTLTQMEKMKALAFLFKYVTGTNNYLNRRLIQFSIKQTLDGKSKFKRISMTAEAVALRYNSLKQWTTLSGR